ncbi:tryptophan halogenase family protein [Ningiella sp. W23]|uniref:tryptophan halogenase family protein n=1 Tax=Ningiella sp. W23 TaxID=3023715 RepID=UPI00375779EF
MQKRLIILGGGTAGWMAANLLRKHLDEHAFSVCLVESPDIGIIGVGEGSTPHLKVFFDELGIDENEWMPACNATFKNGISFVDWTEHLSENRYFHPFPSATDRQTVAAFLGHCHLKFKGVNVSTNPDDYFLAAQLAKKHLAPKTKSPVPLNYAYHFDSHLLGSFLKDVAMKNGVTHISGTVDDIALHPSGDIASFMMTDGKCINGDFFVDASGFRSQLLQNCLQVGFDSFSDCLLNDSAIALPSAVSTPLTSETRASGLKHGWAWHIPLTNRTGNGYVFSQAHCDFSAAEKELRHHINQNTNDDKTLNSKIKSSEVLNVNARRIHMKVGQAKKHWHKNVVAVGLAQGFIEPLEATALHLVLETLIGFITEFKQGELDGAALHQAQNSFNQSMRERYEGIRDYIVCHYKMNTRSDSQYWIDARENTTASDNLAAVIDAWDAHQDITPILKARGMDKYYPAVSWYCLLAGYGRFDSAHLQAPHSKAAQDATHRAASGLRQVEQYLDKACSQFIPHEHYFNPNSG